MAAIADARRRVWLCSGYFVPTEQEQAKLARAARRGVDVRLLLAGVTDAPLVLGAQRASYDPLLEAGVRVQEVRNSVLHAKLGVVDDAWSWVGSSNLDRRSVAWNNEVDAILLGPEAAAALGGVHGARHGPRRAGDPGPVAGAGPRPAPAGAAGPAGGGPPLKAGSGRGNRASRGRPHAPRAGPRG